MRKIIAVLGIAFLGTLGCRHVGGKCDCGPTPGEAGLYAPVQNYQLAPGTKEVSPTPKKS